MKTASIIILALALVSALSIGFASSAPVVERIRFSRAHGPESLAFSPNGEGPYAGVADGRILKWEGDEHGRGLWVPFAVISPFRQGRCYLPYDPLSEPICGRPLGLRFSKKTGELYIADAYFGLQVVPPTGGLATQLVSHVGGKPLLFTNDLDIDEEKDVIYFTDTSGRFQRRDFEKIISCNDMTGRLLKYDKSTKKVTVLLDGLSFANGVTLSRDRSFVLVAESTKSRIMRYWLKGPKAGKHDVFAQLPGSPDNIRMNSRGEFWVGALYGDVPRAIKLNRHGRVVRVLEGFNMFKSMSQIYEKDGKLWIGSVSMPFAGVRSLH